MTWQELCKQTNSQNDSELVWSATEAQLAESDRELLKAFADELNSRLKDFRPTDFVQHIINELLTEAGVER